MQLVLYGSIAWRHFRGFDQVIRWAKDFGWDAVDARGMSLDVEGPLDVRLNAFGYDMLGPKQVRKSARLELREQLEAVGLPFECLYCSSPVYLTGEQGEAARQLFLDYLQLAHDLGAKWVRPINNMLPAPESDTLLSAQQVIDRTLAGLEKMALRAAELDIGLLLENNENSTTPDAESLLAFQNELQSLCRAGIAYDAANAYMQGLDPAQELSKLGSHLSALHVKNVRRHETQRWDYLPKGDKAYEWVLPQDGDLKWQELLQQAAEQGFDGPVVYEYVNPFKGMPLEYWDSIPEPEQAAQEVQKYLRGILPTPQKQT
ncbi:Sugar phosphate isomerase/epimerase [Planctomycetales bacterium 10988]|nr:Sugar phosphate isomerase/epimerase [Planctomycetales bacterium 10988]